MKMSIFLEKALARKSEEQYLRYQLVKKLLIFTDEENKIGIDEKYYSKILLSYLDENTVIDEDGSLVWCLYNFFEKVIDSYILKRSSKYNFLIDESNMKPFLKKWLKERKEDIKKFISFYLGNSFIGIITPLFKNEYFEIFQIKGQKIMGGGWLYSYPDSENIVIRIMVKGKLYYNDGVLLEDNCYVVTDRNSLLGKCMILSDEINMVFVVIKKYFIKRFNLLEPNTKIKIKSNISKEELNKVMDFKYLKQHPFFFLEILINFFKVNSVIDEDSFKFSETVAEENYLSDIQEMILKNINLETEQIERYVENELDISEDILNNYLVKNLDITMKKWITKLKLKTLVERNYVQDMGIDNLRKELAITNIKNLRYNLKAYYDLSVKNMKK